MAEHSGCGYFVSSSPPQPNSNSIIQQLAQRNIMTDGREHAIGQR